MLNFLRQNPYYVVGGAVALATGVYALRRHFGGGVNKYTPATSSARKMKGSVVIVTGGNTGIGFESIIDFRKRGAHVVLACRSKERAEAAQERLEALKLPGSSEFMRLDLADLSSVRTFAKEFQGKYDQLDTLLNNAGVMHVVGTGREQTKDGFELQIGTNHAGHALLSLLLMPQLRAAARVQGASGSAARDDGPDVRVVTVSSLAHEQGHIHHDDPHFLAPDSYQPWKAYSQSKLSNLLFARELQRRLDSSSESDSEIRSWSCHPGVVATELDRNLPYINWARPLLYLFIGLFLKTPTEGAQTSLYLCTAPKVEVAPTAGGYYSDCVTKASPNPEANDLESAQKLWDLTLPMLGLSEEEADAAGLGVPEDCKRLGVEWGKRVVQAPTKLAASGKDKDA